MMSNAKHTEGPWRYVPDSEEFGPGPTVESDFGLIAKMPQPEDEEGRANARLMAASPRLLAALKSAAWFIEDRAAESESADEIHIEMMAAIAEAEGHA